MSDNTTIHREAFWLLVDRRISGGMSRQVYSSKMLPDCVVKVEDTDGFFQNVLEWEAWQSVKNTEWARWFAPCKFISPCGAVLVMARTTEPADWQCPPRMPVFLSDFKRSNYGMLNGKLVCHDYGTHLLMEHGKSKRLRKVDWHDA